MCVLCIQYEFASVVPDYQSVAHLQKLVSALAWICMFLCVRVFVCEPVIHNFAIIVTFCIFRAFC